MTRTDGVDAHDAEALEPETRRKQSRKRRATDITSVTLRVRRPRQEAWHRAQLPYNAPHHAWKRREERLVYDIISVVFVVAFFALCVAYTHACDRILGPDEQAAEATTGSGRGRRPTTAVAA